MKYLIEHAKFSAVATYTRGTLAAFKMQRGTMPDAEYARLPFWLPRREKEVHPVQYGFLISEYKEKPADPFFKKYVAAWFAYYQRITGVRPRFGGTDGTALKSIKKYLESETATQDAALATWQAMLDNMHRIDKFYHNNSDLKFINSQLNKIIIQLKNVTAKATQGHNATDLRREL
ncbi:MAG: hypothetical protein WC198_09220 [Victivallaceae bacterium]|jgi:hypothetical protein